MIMRTPYGVSTASYRSPPMSAAALAEMYRAAMDSGPTCGPSGRSTAPCATEARRDSSAIRSVCRWRIAPTAAPAAVARTTPPTFTPSGSVMPIGFIMPNTTDSTVATAPTIRTSRHDANEAARNGTAANSPM